MSQNQKKTKKNGRAKTAREGFQSINNEELEAVSGGTIFPMQFEWNNTVDSAAAGTS